jgi:hypothetical protein
MRCGMETNTRPRLQKEGLKDVEGRLGEGGGGWMLDKREKE